MALSRCPVVGWLSNEGADRRATLRVGSRGQHRAPRWRHVLCCLLLAGTPTVAAESPPPGVPKTTPAWPMPRLSLPPAPTVEPVAEPAVDEAEPPPPAAAEPDPCDASYLDRNAWIDRVHRRVYRSTCESAFWFDNLFSNQRIYDERNATQGRLALGASWDEREGFEPVTRFRLRYRLPHFRNRLNAIVGRDDENQLIADRGGIGERVPVFFGDPEDDEWLLGLGYSPSSGGRRGRLDAGVGVRVGLPSEPYVNLSYRYHDVPTEKRLIRWRQTLFWESRDGVGITTRVDVERIVGPRRLVRWSNAGTVSEDTEGVDWRSSLTLFQKVGARRGLAYQVGAYGETDAEVTIRDVGFRLVYRQPVLREWLFLDLRPGLAWRKKTQEEARKPIWAFGAALEMRFGHHLRQWSGD